MRAVDAARAAAAALLLLFFAAASGAQECPGGQPLEIVNRSGGEIVALSISRTGMDEWSGNLAKEPLPDGESAGYDIGRDSILGLSDVKISLGDGREKIWRRFPILEVFSVTVNERLEPDYERIKLGP